MNNPRIRPNDNVCRFYAIDADETVHTYLFIWDDDDASLDALVHELAIEAVDPWTPLSRSAAIAIMKGATMMHNERKQSEGDHQ